MMLEEGSYYTRREIHDLLGGEVQTYLPAKDGLVTCACLTLRSNPDAPNTILIGQRPRVLEWARRLCVQGGMIPVFIRRATNEWEYVGKYRVQRCSKKASDIDKYQRLSGRSNLSMVIYLKNYS